MKIIKRGKKAKKIFLQGKIKKKTISTPVVVNNSSKQTELRMEEKGMLHINTLLQVRNNYKEL